MKDLSKSTLQAARAVCISLLSAAAMLAVTAPAYAQDTLEIEEVVVTAQKREQSLQSVPISITAFTGEDIQENGWSSPVDIIAKTPNVNAYSVFGNAFPIFWIRGIGTSDQAHGANSPVGMYANEIYHSSLVGQGFALFDLERVEVLRGPQGTLWGKNTTGGAMNFISKLPGDELEGNMLGEFGLYNDDTPVYKYRRRRLTAAVRHVERPDCRQIASARRLDNQRDQDRPWAADRRRARRCQRVCRPDNPAVDSQRSVRRRVPRDDRASRRRSRAAAFRGPR